ncbi:hypothetical protein CDAR_568191 [Caerostris darwini]|uniref:Uncharacterized protein n=1 Tax=Caerostris darwini TaxID=1538125 RepID=A0AAV4UU09_9ARAC|nr:hypothetical protein CDAR_568191 [Caerostris darwini]
MATDRGHYRLTSAERFLPPAGRKVTRTLAIIKYLEIPKEVIILPATADLYPPPSHKAVSLKKIEWGVFFLALVMGSRWRKPPETEDTGASLLSIKEWRGEESAPDKGVQTLWGAASIPTAHCGNVAHSRIK